MFTDFWVRFVSLISVSAPDFGDLMSLFEVWARIRSYVAMGLPEASNL